MHFAPNIGVFSVKILDTHIALELAKLRKCFRNFFTLLQINYIIRIIQINNQRAEFHPLVIAK